MQWQGLHSFSIQRTFRTRVGTHTHKIKVCLERKQKTENINSEGSYRFTPIHVAAYHGDVEEIKFLAPLDNPL